MDIDELKDKRIAVLLSGGVDSSVVVYEFARLGLRISMAAAWRSSTVIANTGIR